MPRRRKGQEKAIAAERMDALSVQAAAAALAHEMPRADRYATLARKIGMRYNVRLPRGLRARLCRKCLRYLMPGVSCTVRVSRGRVRTTCTYCGHVHRHPYTKEQKARRR